MPADAPYNAEDFLRDLNKLWDGSASEDVEASLDFFLLDALRLEGSQGVTNMLLQFSPERLGTMTVSKSGTEVIHRVVREGMPELSIAAFADLDTAWVNIIVESPPRSHEHDDPRHAAFYAIWERLIGEASDPKKDDTNDRAVFLMALLESEVNNGGLGQYLTNTNAEYLSETLACLERIGASKTHEVLLAAVELGGNAESWVANWDDESERYSDLDTDFYESGEDLAGLTADEFLDV